MIGFLLGIPKKILSGIEKMYQNDPYKSLEVILQAWLEQVHPTPTWAAIIEAVEFIGEKRLGKQLQNKYCATVPQGKSEYAVDTNNTPPCSFHV